ncbi:hypothetical protein D7Y23_36195, partial [Corallococcus sp. AB050B]
TIEDSELHDVLPDAWNGSVNLLTTRPFTTAQQLADTAVIGSLGSLCRCWRRPGGRGPSGASGV